MEVVAKNISKRLGSFLLGPVDLEVSSGERITLLGPNGAGKTTLLRILALLDEPDSGELFLDGLSAKLERERLRKRITMVFAEPVFLKGSVEYNLEYGLRLRGLGEREIRRRILDSLKIVDLPPDILGRNVLSLSTGEKKRLSLARALSLEPDLLLLDEPSSGLDRRSLQSILEALEDFDGTIVSATHDLQIAIEISDRLALMRDGRILQVGRVEDIFSRPRSLDLARILGYDNEIPGVVLSASGEIVLVSSGNLVLEARKSDDLEEGDECFVVLRSSDITISKDRSSSSARNVVECRVRRIVWDSLPLIMLDAGGFSLRARITRASLESLGIREGDRVFAIFKASSALAVRSEKEQYAG